jgi:hypothetical protein
MNEESKLPPVLRKGRGKKASRWKRRKADYGNAEGRIRVERL